MSTLLAIAYAYDADMHCPECALERFGDKLDDPKTEDSEGNPLGAVFSWDEGSEHGTYCGDCSAEISAPWCEGCEDCRQHAVRGPIETPPNNAPRNPIAMRREALAGSRFEVWDATRREFQCAFRHADIAMARAREWSKEGRATMVAIDTWQPDHESQCFYRVTPSDDTHLLNEPKQAPST